MIEKNVKIHDRFQFEIKLGYGLKKDRKKTAYHIDSYFFIPDSLGINSHTYTNTIFYKDIQNYIRLKTPTLLLRQIAGPGPSTDTPSPDTRSPVTRLKESLDTLILRRDKPAREDFEYHVKMLCSIAKSALRDHVVFAQKSASADVPDMVAEFVSEAQKLTAQYRGLKPVINVPTTTEKSMAIFRFGDEFLSQSIDLYGFRLLKRLDEIHTVDMAASRAELTALLKTEYDHRVSAGYHDEPGKGKDEENEVLIYRRGVLKKYIGSVLFLDTSREPEGTFLEQFLISIAAGLSMVFATVTAFWAQKEFGNFTFPLFTLLVLSYIFKDRIKELTRTYFVKRLNKSRFDHKTDIYSDERRPIGRFKEAMNFIDESELPKKIKTIRKKDHIAEVENRWRGEKVIFYRKQVTLFSRRLENVYKDFNIEGVNDIVRFNINRFLTRMDNPSRKIYTLDDGEVCEITGNRVYHINLIIKISREEKVSYKRVRVTLTRRGIIRIKEIDLQ